MCYSYSSKLNDKRTPSLKNYLNTERSVSDFQPLSMNLVMAGFEFQAWHWAVCAAPAAVVESLELTPWCHRTLQDHHPTPTPQPGRYLNRQHPFNYEFSIQAVFMDCLLQFSLTVLVTPKVLHCSSFRFHQVWGEGAIARRGSPFAQSAEMREQFWLHLRCAQCKPTGKVTYKDNGAAKKSDFRFYLLKLKDGIRRYFQHLQ